MRDFIEKMEETLDEENNTSYTENRAKGYKTTNNLLLDLTFKIPELREAAISGVDIYEEYFKEAFYENPKLALKWLLYVRDIRKGLGERSIFRKLMVGLSNDEVFSEDPFKIIDFAEYGRWDDIIDIMWNTGMKNFQDWACDYIAKRLSKDYVNLEKENLFLYLPNGCHLRMQVAKRPEPKLDFLLRDGTIQMELINIVQILLDFVKS